MDNLIERRMSNGEPFTYGDLRAITLHARDAAFIAGKLIQSWRRKGWIEMRGLRRGRAPLWHLTPAGAAINTAREVPHD